MRLVLATMFCAIAGCTTSSTTPSDDRQTSNELKKHDDSAQRTRLLEIAANYKSYEQIDKRMRFAPAPCAAPDRPGGNDLTTLSDYHLSRSTDESTHGRKLYVAYALKLDSISRTYTGESLSDEKKPLTDQVIVKESWIAEEIKKGDPVFGALTGSDGKRYHRGAKGPLFVMYQTDAKDPNSDDGWVYGTLTPDGKTVIGVGRLENCMKCHQKAPHGRLFGLPKD